MFTISKDCQKNQDQLMTISFRINFSTGSSNRSVKLKFDTDESLGVPREQSSKYQFLKGTESRKLGFNILIFVWQSPTPKEKRTIEAQDAANVTHRG